MAFRNSILAGIKLIRAAVQSPNYAAGSAGWTINQDGSAEFNNIVIRGGTVVSGIALYYNGAPAFGNLIMSIAAVAGTDDFGNAYVSGIASYAPDGSILQMEAGAGANITFSPQSADGPWVTGAVDTVTATSPTRRGLSITPPAHEDHPFKPGIELYGGSATSDATSILMQASSVDINSDVRMNNLQSGTAQTPAPGGVPAQTSVNVTFPLAFTSTPRVVVTPNSAAANLNTSNIRWAITNKTTTGFTINCWRDSNNATNFEWIAHL